MPSNHLILCRPLLLLPSVFPSVRVFSNESVDGHSQIRLPRWLSGKEPTCQYTIHRRFRFDPWVGKTPWRRKWQPTLGFLPGESHGQRSLAGYSPWGHRWVRHDRATKQQQHQQHGQIEQNNQESSTFLFLPNISSFTTYTHTRVCLCMHYTAITTFRITVEFEQEEKYFTLKHLYVHSVLH